MGTALDWMISGRVFDAEEAHASGLVHRLYEADEVLPAAYELAAELAAKTAPISVAVTRHCSTEWPPSTPRSQPATSTRS